MSKNKLDEIEVRSKKSGTVGGTIGEALTKTSKDKLDKIEAESRQSGTVTGKTHFTKKVIRFREYEIVVDLTSDGKFVGIEEVRINKDFRDYNQMTRQKAFKYIDSYHPE